MFSRRKFIKTVVVIGCGNVLQSFAADTFMLPPADAIKLRFAIASDGHYGQPETPYEQNHREMMQWLNEDHAKRGIDFTVFNGDLVHDDSTYFQAVKASYDQLHMPYYVSHGNHDKTDPDTWEKTWKIPLHFAFVKKDVAFLILDTADDTGGYICPNLAWTKTHLLKYKAYKHLFVFMHITPFKWTTGGISCPDLTRLFEQQANLKAVFHGHDHDQDYVRHSGQKPYFFDSHIGGNWGTSYRGYRIVEVLKTGEVLTYQVNPTLARNVNNSRIR